MNLLGLHRIEALTEVCFKTKDAFSQKKTKNEELEKSFWLSKLHFLLGKWCCMSETIFASFSFRSVVVCFTKNCYLGSFAVQIG